jgi:hypothetical protein
MEEHLLYPCDTQQPRPESRAGADAPAVLAGLGADNPQVPGGYNLGVAKAGQMPLPPLSDFALYSGLPPLSVSVVVLLVVFSGFGEETGAGCESSRTQARTRVHNS